MLNTWNMISNIQWHPSWHTGSSINISYETAQEQVTGNRDSNFTGKPAGWVTVDSGKHGHGHHDGECTSGLATYASHCDIDSAWVGADSAGLLTLSRLDRHGCHSLRVQIDEIDSLT